MKSYQADTKEPLSSANLGFEIALLILLAFLWGSSYLFIKVALESIPPITLIAARVVIAAVFLLTILTWKGDRLPTDLRTWRMLFIQAAVQQHRRMDRSHLGC